MSDGINILAVDTSTSTLHIALSTPAGDEERMVRGGFQHSEDLLAEIMELLKRRGLSINDLGLLACTRGPGSFTSLRIAMSELKGFSLATGAPLVSVPTLKCIASAWALPGIPTLAVIDAKKRRYYLGLYKDGEALCEDIDGNVADIKETLAGLESLAVTGPDAEAFAVKLEEALPQLKLYIDPQPSRPLGLCLARLAQAQYEAIGADDIGQGLLYIRRSDAEEALLAKKAEKEE